MTSASELFYNRRSRYNSRATHNDLGFDSLCPPDRIYNRRHHNHHHDSSAAAAPCDVILRRPSSRHHRVSLTERGGAAIGLEQGAQSGPGNWVGEVTGNERLPGAVVLARERLVERLRGMPPSENRRRRALQIYRSGLMFREDMGSVDERDTQLASDDSQSSDLSSQIESLQLLQEANKKPPGLTQEDLQCLSVEFFCGAERGVDGLVSRASRDCSICLESFIDGEELICLPCVHRFHSACLGPWVRIRGDCPYCRRVIVVDCHTAKQTM